MALPFKGDVTLKVTIPEAFAESVLVVCVELMTVFKVTMALGLILFTTISKVGVSIS